MKQTVFPIAAILVLSACARVEPIDLNEVEEVDQVAIENVVEEAGALPAINPDYNWVVDGQRATYGPNEGAQLLALECTNGSLDIARFAESTSGAGTLVFGAGGALATVAVAAGGQALGEERYEASLAPGDIGDDLIAVFADGTPINVTMTGAEPLIVAADAAVGSLVVDCIGREGEAEEIAPANADAETATPS